ncbi:hypothetical protein SAMN05216603_101572 [Pseudomonas benzenivorans]|nr:hypothetical protein [Pseudomonas benzenivorans]SDG40398.1 hypothetical protein SAMN05216603_101572 [Pseudomonas benzenivorans]
MLFKRLATQAASLWFFFGCAEQGMAAAVLPTELEIFPGQQAGSACGARLSGKPPSTIGLEKRRNAAPSMDKAGFIERLTASVPPRPADMERIVTANMAP